MSEDIDTEYQQYPTCPKCGFADQDWWDGPTFRDTADGSIRKYKCGNCFYEYEVECHYSVDFTSYKIEGGEE